MLGDIVTGINLVKQSVAFIKENIATAKDISSIASQIDDLFEGKNQLDKKRSKKDGVSLADQFGVKSVANEIIDAKLAAEKLYEVSVLVDQRFGHGTWQAYLNMLNAAVQNGKITQATATAMMQKLLERQADL